MSTPPPNRFPFADRPRLWGVSVSHYQVEGNDPCDWTEWESAGRTRGEPCGSAVDSWRLYEYDAELAREAGANAFRFSVSWSRVQPRQGETDQNALQRYRRFVDHLHDLSIEPCVTLFHYTHPRWFHDTTPWTSTSSVDEFVQFAIATAEALGPGVRMWTLFNEPLVFLLAGYIDGQIPPGLADTRAARTALEHILRSHALAAAEIRRINPAAAIGVAHNMMDFAPQRAWNPFDRVLSVAAHRFYNVALPRAFRTGRWRMTLPPATVFRGSFSPLVDSLDFFGVNFYSRLHMLFPGRERWVGEFGYEDRSGRGLTDNGWEIVPGSFERMLLTAGTFSLPVVVTENGIADRSDRMRADFIRMHAQAIRNAEAGGTAVHGYFYWSLVDNFEWLEGYEPAFGLYEVDRRTMQRTARPSLDVFREEGRRFLGSTSVPR